MTHDPIGDIHGHGDELEVMGEEGLESLGCVGAGLVSARRNVRQRGWPGPFRPVPSFFSLVKWYGLKIRIFLGVGPCPTFPKKPLELHFPIFR